VTRKRNSSPLEPLSRSEMEVMKFLWARGQAAARDVQEAFLTKKGWAANTVRTFLRRMVEKGWLRYEQIGNSYLYKPAVTRTKATRGVLSSVIGEMFDGGLSPVISLLGETPSLSEEEIRALERVVREQRARLSRKREAE
jgi:BlaI family penicillinase repressor